MRHALRSLAALALLLSPALAGDTAADTLRLERLRVLGEREPRAFFFRAAEGQASNPNIPLARWEATFERLMGIEGKVLDEEVPGRSERNIEFFTRFKAAHLDQLVLLHFNGNARDPRDASSEYFAGHWLYHDGTTIRSDVPAAGGEAEITVDDPGLFQVGIGRYRRDNDDVALCALDAEGRPDWRAAEQVELLAVEPARGVIRVRRGCFGTVPRAFAAGRAWAAAHVSEGPWGRRSRLLWAYNHATTCPEDEQGRRAGDILVAEIAGWFAPGGRLVAFDGLEFDVLAHSKGSGGSRGIDVDGDGRRDGGVVDGKNVYGLGVLRFLTRLREALGEDRLILADGHGEHHQRGFGILNGIESEGFPTLSDHDLSDWSGGLNRHAFWAANGRRPAFSYINHKFAAPGDAPGKVVRPDVPFSAHRLVFAAALFSDSAICYSFAPPDGPDGRLGIWDELWLGSRERTGWLGRPLGPAVHLATRVQDELGDGQGDPSSLARLRSRLCGDRVRFRPEGQGLTVEPGVENRGDLRFLLRDVPCDGPDLYVQVTASCDPLPGYPVTMARLMHVGVTHGLPLASRDGIETGMRRRGGDLEALDPSSGGSVRFDPRLRIAGVAKPGYSVHPPYRPHGRVGMVYWQRSLELPPDARLVFFTGMGERAPGRSDGVVFGVEIAATSPGRPERFESIFEHRQVAAEWVRHEVDLESRAGEIVTLRFVADVGPADNATTDHGRWGDIRVLSGQPNPGPTRSQVFMTWVNGRPFTSGFYFDAVRSRAVDLVVTVEGSAPLHLHAVSAHAAPEVVHRPYENGIVLANLSPRAVALDLEELAPGRRLRRIPGTPRQDPATNTGARVGKRLVLPGRDALLLLEERPPARPGE